MFDTGWKAPEDVSPTFKQYTARRRRVSSLPFCRSLMMEWCTSSFCSPRKCAETAFRL